MGEVLEFFRGIGVVCIFVYTEELLAVCQSNEQINLIASDGLPAQVQTSIDGRLSMTHVPLEVAG